MNKGREQGFGLNTHPQVKTYIESKGGIVKMGLGE
ncbi:restriction endonuclease fold toxin [Neisseria cinerea]